MFLLFKLGLFYQEHGILLHVSCVIYYRIYLIFITVLIHCASYGTFVLYDTIFIYFILSYIVL